MRKSRFSEETIYVWRKRFGAMQAGVHPATPGHRPAGSIRSGRVIEVVAQLVTIHGATRVLRSANGPEFVSTALLRWASEKALDMALIEPGRSWQNGTAEGFNGRLRDECLSMEWFRSRAEARVVIEQCRQHYHQVDLSPLSRTKCSCKVRQPRGGRT